MNLGLVCISEMIKARGIRFNTMTKAQFTKTGDVGELERRALNNITTVVETIKHCASIGISHYRIPSSILPLYSCAELGLTIPDSVLAALPKIGSVAADVGVTLSTHPNQFNVLASYNPKVVESTVVELGFQAQIMDLIISVGNPNKNTWQKIPMVLHPGCSPRNGEPPKEYVNRFCSAASRIPGAMIVIENEDKGFWNCAEVHEHFGSRFPLVYDNLHDSCNPSPEDDWVDKFSHTWNGVPPLFHWSEGVNSTRKHAERFSHIPAAILSHPSAVWECEVKDKDLAIVEILDNYKYDE